MQQEESRWQRLRVLFDRATDLPTGQRQAFVNDACLDDSSLRDELSSLLEADQCQKKKPLTDAVGAALDAAVEERRQRLLGTRVSRYRLTTIIGHGGVGTVYRGEAIDSDIAVPVAIKIVERAALHADTRRRFYAERQILADLDHPNITRMFDAGETDDGYPYLVMEYIEGEPIDRYCDRRRLNIEARIRLFLQVCDAVQYAHGHLVLHRDLKPMNILVTPEGTPKLLDFGLAKLLDPTSTSAFSITRVQDQLLTPEYSSPEQIRGQPLTTASDVYALGILIYELLTGIRPYEVSSESRLEVERAICNCDAPIPSTTVANASRTMGLGTVPSSNIHAAAVRRSTTPTQLRSYLRGDLDAIVLRALRKKPEDRYDSVDELGADLQRHLACEPVLARKGGWLYILGRSSRRYAWPIASITLLVAMACLEVIWLHAQSERFTAERDNAKQGRATAETITNFMTSVFDADTAARRPHQDTAATDLLDRAKDRIFGNLTSEPHLRARLLEAIGWSYHGLGRNDEAIELLSEAVGIRRHLPATKAIELGTAIQTLGYVRFVQSDLVKATTDLTEAREIFETNNLDHTAQYALTLSYIGRVERLQGRLEDSMRHQIEALSRLRAIYGSRHPEIAGILTAIAIVLELKGDMVAMEKALREAHDIYRATAPPSHPELLLTSGMLGRNLLYQGKLSDAAPIIEQYITARAKVLGEDNLQYSDDLQDLIELRRAQDRLDEAEEYARKSLAMDIRHRGLRNQHTAYTRTTLGAILWLRGKHSEAEQELREARSAYLHTFSEPHLYIASVDYFLTETLLARGRLTEGSRIAKHTIESLKALDAPAWRIARTESTIGEFLFHQRRLVEAREFIERSYATLVDSSGVEPDTVRLARDRLERFYLATGDTAKLAALRAQSVERERH